MGLKKLSKETTTKIEALRERKPVEQIKRNSTLMDYLNKLFKAQTQAITQATANASDNKAKATKSDVVPLINKEFEAIQKKIKFNEASKRKKDVISQRDEALGVDTVENKELIELAIKHKIIDKNNAKELNALKYNLRKSPEEYKTAIMNEVAERKGAAQKVYFHDKKNGEADVATEIYERMKNGRLEQEFAVTPIIDNNF